MFKELSARFAVVLLLMLSVSPSMAQPLLPDMIGSTQEGMNILSWSSQYNGIKSIAVQRSSDSVYNFVTIGYVKDLNKGPQAFIDGHPLPGTNWYRLYIVFSSSLTWYSNYIRLDVDSMALLQQKVLPPNDSLQKLASGIVVVDEVPVPSPNNTAARNSSEVAPIKRTPRLTIPALSENNTGAAVYIKSQFIFTNPFTGHVNVELPDYRQHSFTVKFFNQNNMEVFSVPPVREPMTIIDKRNFQRKGIYKFELMKDKELFESGYITIY